MKKDIEDFYDENEDDFYTKKDLEQDRFYKMDKNLFNNSKYKGLSLGAKVVFSVLKDRQSLSESNQDDWLDEKNRIFFYFDCIKLSELLEISTSTLNRYKKELEDYNLLFQFRQGQGKPNRMYCKKPKSIDNALISQNDKSRKVKSTRLELSKRLTNDTEFNITEYSETDIVNRSSQKNVTLLNYKNKKEYMNDVRKYIEFDTEITDILELFYDRYLQYNNKYNHYKIDKDTFETVIENLNKMYEFIDDSYQLTGKTTLGIMVEFTNSYFEHKTKHSIKNFSEEKTLMWFLTTIYKKHTTDCELFFLAGKGKGRRFKDSLSDIV